MDYNTKLGKISFREYGRNIQKLVDYAKTIEDRYERTAFTKAIINLMGQMHPHLRNIEEFRSKLWAQLYVMADFDLDVDSPFPVPTSIEEVNAPPSKVSYPQSKLKFRHYGKNVEQLIAKAVEMEEGDKKEAFVRVIANYMKMVYKSWNRETVSDDLIKGDLVFLSEERLAIPEGVDLDNPPPKYSNNGRGSKRKKMDYDNNGGGGHRGGRGHRGGGGRGGSSNNYHSNNNNNNNYSRRYK